MEYHDITLRKKLPFYAPSLLETGYLSICNIHVFTNGSIGDEILFLYPEYGSCCAALPENAPTNCTGIEFHDSSTTDKFIYLMQNSSKD